MTRGRLDRDYANDVRHAAAIAVPRTAGLLILCVGALLIGGLVWAATSELEEVTRADGRVVPSQQLQVVQVLEPGIVERIYVREGDSVEEGALVLKIDETSRASQLGEVSQRRMSTIARLARLEAEAVGRPGFEVDTAITLGAPEVVEAERDLFTARARRQTQDIAVLQQQLRQRRQELDEMKANQRRLQQGVDLADREFQIADRLRRQGAMPEIEVLRLQRQLSQFKGELDVVERQIPRGESAIVEVEERLSNSEASFRAAAREELSKARADLAVLDETLKAATDRFRRAELRSPARGIVNRVAVTSVGAVVQPGQTLVEIVPLDDVLLIEARVRPQDVAFIRPGQRAIVKITAYDFATYGSLQGAVERISADTLANERNETFYRVVIRTTETHLGSGEQRLPILPGMIALVDIVTGQKTVLAYLLRPLTRVRTEALRER